MTAAEGSPTCEVVRDELAELALGTLTGRQRSAALAHVASCRGCRAELEHLALAADALVQLAPSVEPPVGFEVRLFERTGLGAAPAPRRRRRRRVSVVGAAVAAGVVLAGLAFGAGWVAGPGQGSTPGGRLTSAPLVAAGRQVGQVTLDAGGPSWLFMTVADAERSAEVTCEVTTSDGRSVRVGSFWLSPGGYGAWGAVLAVPGSRVRSARVVAADGTVVASAALGT